MFKNKNATLLESLVTSVMVFDGDLELLSLNGSAERLLSTSARMLRGLGAGEIFVHNPDCVALLEKALREDHTYTDHELELFSSAHALAHTVIFTVSPIRLTNNQKQVLAEIFPLDRARWLAREEIRLDQHHVTQQVVRGLAHEIKNPLGGLRGAAQLLDRRLDDEDLKGYTQVIVRESDRLRALVDRLRGPVVKANLRQTNIHEVFEHVRQLVSVELPGYVRIRTQYDVSLPEIGVDPDMMTQALLNIVRNAANALLENGKNGAGGEIVLRTRIARQIVIGHHRYRLLLRLDIEDNGPGIPEELRETIFYPMVTGRAEGTGMGLAVVNDIINQHNGLIEFDSEPGKTLFKIFLPFRNN